MRENGSQRRKRQARDYLEAALIRGDAPAEIYRAMQLELGWVPSRSTVYAWAKDWQEARARDQSGRWSLATDETGRPDIVLRVLAALIATTHGRMDDISVDEARWLVKLARAVPEPWPDHVFRAPPKGEPDQYIEVKEPGPIRLLIWAGRCADAENSGDTNALALYDDYIAMEYWFEDWHKEAWAASKGGG